MIHSTKGIVLRTIKYGETSVIATVLTELFGVQSYIVNGVRTQSKTSKAHFFQPSSILDLQVYQSDLKNLQRIKELKWNYLYKNVLSNVAKNGVALYMVELMYKCLKQPEANPDLFNFCEDAFMALDTSAPEIAANFPIYFSIHLAGFFGFSIQDNRSNRNLYFNPAVGGFVSEESAGIEKISIEISANISDILKARHPRDLKEIKLNRNIRKTILAIMESYYAFHIPEFGTMKTLPVLHELL